MSLKEDAYKPYQAIFTRMENPEVLGRVRENILKRTSTDRVMWFSMWFLLSVITFGSAFFPMLYLLIERRNKHFLRQKELEDILISELKNRIPNFEIENDYFYERSPLLWIISIIFIVPIFFIAYFLSKDLLLHEKRQMALFRKIFPEEEILEQKINIKLCLAVTIATCGVGIIYWFYKIFNSYNIHFKEQWKIEDKIAKMFEEAVNK